MALTKISTGMLKQDAASSDLNIDAGTLYLDVSNNHVGIGTTSPVSKLHVQDGNLTILTPSGTGGRYLSLDNRHTGGRDYRLISTNDSHGSLGGGDFAILDYDISGNDAAKTRLLIDSSGNVGIVTGSPSTFANYTNVSIKGGSSGVNLDFHNSSGARRAALVSSDGGLIVETNTTATPIMFKTGATPAERMRIDSSGNIMISKTVTAVGTAGHTFGNDGYVYHTRAGDIMFLNRTGSDGSHIVFYKNTSAVGTIGTANSGDLYIGNDDTTLLFAGGSDAIIPRGTAGAARDAAISLGLASHRFNNLYMSGNIQMGGNLDVVGQIGAYNNPSSSWGTMNFRATDYIFKNAGGTEKMRIDSSGRFLIGTTSTTPAFGNTDGHAFHVGDASHISRDQGTALTINRGTNDGDILNFRKSGASIGSIGSNSAGGVPVLDISAHSSSGIMRMLTSGAERMRLDQNGNVGIGIATPQTKLQVNGANQTFAAHFGQGTANSSGNWGGISLGYSEASNNNYRKVGIAAKAVGDNAARQELHFLVDANNDGNNADIGDSKMMIDISGNVGIGTSSPAGQLHVFNSSAGVQFISSSNSALRLVSTGGANYIQSGTATSSSSAAALIFTNVGGTGETMRIDSSGNVLVGTTDTTPYNNSANSTADRGIVLRSEGYISAAAYQQSALDINRTGNNGNVVNFYRSGASAGSISVNDGYIGVGAGAVYLGYYTDGSNNKSIIPMANSTGAAAAGTIGLGINNANHKFKDAWITGAVNAATLNIDGGTIKLDGNHPGGTENVALGSDALYTIHSSGNFNVAIGSEALYSTTTGDNNTGVGHDALRSNTTASNNTALGFQALRANTTGESNVGISHRALYSNSTGAGNIGIGLNALYTNTTADHNIALGTAALDANTTGAQNVGIGVNALGSNTTASYNTGVGSGALSSNTTGLQSVAVGAFTLDANTTGNYNVGVGYGVLTASTTASDNTAMGLSAGAAVTTGARNVLIGRSVAESITTGSDNIYIGYVAGVSATTGNYNTAIGREAFRTQTTASYNTGLGYRVGYSNTTGQNNVFIGYNAGDHNTTGGGNVFIGTVAGDANTTGSGHVVVGYAALDGNTTGTENTAIGSYALTDNSTGSGNTAVGREALANNTTAGENVAVGKLAMYTTTTGGGNVAVGTQSLRLNTTGISNVATGHYAMRENTTGGYNTAVGQESLRYGSSASANSNTALGFQAGYLTNAAGNTAIGVRALHQNVNGDSNVAIGYEAGKNYTSSNATFIGYEAGEAVTTGAQNVGIGRRALQDTTTGGNNTSVGTYSMLQNTTGEHNTVLGYYALGNNTTANQSTAVGSLSLHNSTGTSNVAVGYHTSYANTTGISNSSFGTYALKNNTSGNYNTALGGDIPGATYAALSANTTGSNNVAVGTAALRSNTTASGNTAVGYRALDLNTTSAQNTAVGIHAGLNNTGAHGTFIGAYCGLNNTSGNYNTAVGNYAFAVNQTGERNTAVGRAAMYANSSGNYNTALGYDSLAANTTANYNVAIGYQAGYAVTTGIRNTLLGSLAGDSITTGNGNVVVGESSGSALTTGTDNTMVGPKSGQLMTTGSDNTIIGNFSGNQNSIDIRTSSSNVILSDGDGTVRLRYTTDGHKYETETDGSSTLKHIRIAKKVSCTGSSVTRHTIDIGSEFGATGNQHLRYEVSILGYGTAGSNGLNAKYSVGGYSGHNYSQSNYGSFGAGTIQNGYKSSNSTSYHAVGHSYHPAINMGSYISSGEVYVYVPGAQQYGFTVSNDSSTTFEAILVVEGWYTDT